MPTNSPHLSRRTMVQTGLLAPWLIAGCTQPAHTITGSFVGISPERGHLLRKSGATHALPQSPSASRSVHTLIAGGGVAGLSAARALRLQGMDDFALLELEDMAGGNARAGNMAGMPHPLGAHYLPVPSKHAPEVQDFLEELGLRQRVAGRWQYDERHLCHSPQERLYFNGAWQEGLLPTANVGASTLAQYAQFAQLVALWQTSGGFQMPTPQTAAAQSAKAQLAMPFAAYLAAQGLSDVHLIWYLDYCCRDDYGAGIGTVSAWAGIHYFAARHGFAAPGGLRSDALKNASAEADKAASGVLTWPEGNARLTQALAQPLGARVHTGRVIMNITEGKRGVTVDALNVQTQAMERWQAQRCIVALPVFIAARVVREAPDFLRAAVVHTTYASWLVANVHVNAALQGGAGTPAAWDNVIYQAPMSPAASAGGLGYVDAMHQSTRITPGPSVLTYYRALGTSAQARQRLVSAPWSVHRDETLADLALAHPDIYQRAVQVDITRYGHAMAVPTTVWTSLPAPHLSDRVSARSGFARLGALNYAPRWTPRTARLRFAHSDWSGYSVMEEAFTAGLHAAL